MLKKIIIVLFGVMLFACAQAGDFDEGIAAFEREDYSTAANHFTKAAEKGHLEAQIYLAEMYYKGK